MRTLVTAILAATMLAAPAAAEAKPRLSPEAKLEKLLEGRIAGEPQDCIFLPSIRNTRVIDIVQELQQYNVSVDVHDPWVDAAQAKHEYGLDLVQTPAAGHYDAVILAVAHRQFIALGGAGVRAFAKPCGTLFDVQRVLSREDVDDRL